MSLMKYAGAYIEQIREADDSEVSMRLMREFGEKCYRLGWYRATQAVGQHLDIITPGDETPADFEYITS